MWCVTVTLHTAQIGCPWSGQTYFSSLCTICSNCTCLCALCCCVRSCSKHQVSSSCMSILHAVTSSGPWSTQTHGLPGVTFTSPEYSSDSVDSQSRTKLSSEEVEESKHQGSKVSNARAFTRKSLVTTHQDVTCAFSPTMQVSYEPAGGESDPHVTPAAVKSECMQKCYLSVCPCWFRPPI